MLLFSTPDLYSKLSKCATDFGRNDIAEKIVTFAPVVTGLLSMVAVTGRVKVGDVWTPKIIPGPNKEVLVDKFNEIKKRDANAFQFTDQVLSSHREIASRLTEMEARVAAPTIVEVTPPPAPRIQNPSRVPEV